jgi:Flp pilus assembly protein CpaB
VKASRLNLVIALVLALAAGISVFLYTSTARTAVQSTEQVQEVVVAKQVIPVGTTLADANSKGLLTTDKYPVGTLPAGYITAEQVKATQAASRVSQVSIPKGMILNSSNFGLVTDDKPNLGPLQIPEGLFAVSVSAPDADHVGSFIVPGVDVAVFCTYSSLTNAGSNSSSGSGNAQEQAALRTRLLVDSAKVIGVGSATTPAAAAANSSGGKNSNGLITLAADQKNSQKIIQCSRDGLVYLSLLGTGTVAVPDEGVSSENLFKE